MILLANQHTVPVFLDIANAFAKTDEPVTLLTGNIEIGGVPIDPRIKVIRRQKYDRSTTRRRLWTWLKFSWSYFWYLLFCEKPSLILVVTNPPTAPAVTAVASIFRRFRYSVVVFDLYPEALVQTGFIKSNGLIFRVWGRLNRWCFRRAEHIFTLSDSMKKSISHYAGSKEIQVVHNWADAGYIKPMPRETNVFAINHQLLSKKVVIYSGNMGLTHDLESVILAAVELRDDPAIQFLMIGEGGKKEMLMSMAAKLNADNVRFLPHQEAVVFPSVMAAADVAIVTLGTGAEGISVPSKTYVALAAGLCLAAIAPADSELAEIISRFKVGLHCEPNNPKALAMLLRRTLNDQDKLSEFKANALRASSSFSMDNANRYVETMLRKSN